MQNEKIRQLAKQKHVYLWQIADRFGTTDANFSRWMRKPFGKEKEEKAIQYINEIAESRKA